MIRTISFFALLLLLISWNHVDEQTKTKLRNFHVVDQDLFRSAQPNSTEMRELEKLGVRSVVNLRMANSDEKKMKRSNLVKIHLPMKAEHVTYEDVVRTMIAIRDAPKPVLIHCRRGSDRTGCMVAFYRMVFLNWEKEAAIEAFVDPRYGYLQGLFPNLVELIRITDIDQLKKQIFKP